MLIALFADLFIRDPAFARLQVLGVVIGAVVILAGVYLWSQGKAFP